MSAVRPIIPFLHHIRTFDEPCAADGRLVRHLQSHGKQVQRYFDLTPDSPFVGRGDALATGYGDVDAVITNPPWDRPILHSMIVHFVESSNEAWLLFDANWANTRQSVPFMKWCTDIVPIGRHIWIDGTKMAGKDDASWYRFSADSDGQTIHHPRC
jgi:hypothetical protein